MSKCGSYSRSVKSLQSCESCQTSLTRALNQITGQLTSGACCSSENGSKSNAETASRVTSSTAPYPIVRPTPFGVRPEESTGWISPYHEITCLSDNQIAGKRATFVIFVHQLQGYIQNEGNRWQRKERRSPCGGRHQMPMVCWIWHLGSKAHERIQSAPVAAHFTRPMP